MSIRALAVVSIGAGWIGAFDSDGLDGARGAPEVSRPYDPAHHRDNLGFKVSTSNVETSLTPSESARSQMAHPVLHQTASTEEGAH